MNDYVTANLLATTAPASEVAGQVFNLACGQRYTLLELVEILNDLMGTDIQPQFDTSRKGDVKHSLAAIEKAQAQLGYTVQVDFVEGLRRTIDWYQAI